MREMPSFRSVVRRILSSGDYQRISNLGNGAPKLSIPRMISSAEMAFFSESAARYVGKEGAIVDLGCWLGSTSVALAQGILDYANADNTKEKVLGFDTFVWEEWMPAQVPYCLYETGDSFLPEARRVVRDNGGGAVELVREDLSSYEWEGGPIKILLVDAMKHQDLASQITRSFFPSLLAGGLLIHQDFKHYYTSWIHVLQYRLRDYFRFYQSVPKSGTVAFKVLTAVPSGAIHQAADFATIQDDEIDASFRHSLDLVGPADAASVAAAHVMHYLHLGRKARASDIVENYRSRAMLDKGEFPEVLDRLQRMP